MNAEKRARTSAALLRIARWAVGALAVIAVVGLVAGTWLFRAYAAANASSFTLTPAWTPRMMAAAVAQLGWSPLAIPWYQYTRDIINFFAYVSLGLIMLWRGPRTWFGVFAALTFVAGGYSNSYMHAVASAFPLLGVLTNTMGQFAWQFLFMLFYIFPDGHFVPRWTRWLIIPWLILNLPFLAPLISSGGGWWLPVPLVMTTIGSQVYRYFRKSGPVERAQTRWIVYILACLAPLMLAYGLFVPLSADRAPEAGQLASAMVTTLIWQTASWLGGLLLPIAFAIAILRYHLWDVDVVIRRTLVYATVTALLALVFYGTVLAFQRLFTGITGQQSSVAIVGSTLLIAALFGPLRLRVQDLVDRRFYRRKYDAQQVLAQFATVARDETDIDRLTAELGRAVDEAMRPSTISVKVSRS